LHHKRPICARYLQNTSWYTYILTPDRLERHAAANIPIMKRQNRR
jgi:hypothetical protein